MKNLFILLNMVVLFWVISQVNLYYNGYDAGAKLAYTDYKPIAIAEGKAEGFELVTRNYKKVIKYAKDCTELNFVYAEYFKLEFLGDPVEDNYEITQ